MSASLYAVDVTTNRSGYEVMRTITVPAGAALDSALTTSTKLYSSSKTKIFSVPSKWNNIEITFNVYDATGANPTSGTYYVYAFRGDAVAKFVCYGSFALSSTTTATDTYTIDTMSITNQDWLTDVKSSDGTGTSGDGVSDAGNASISFDTCGYDGILVLVTALTGVAENDVITIKGAGW
jgi:hypothetical protein